MLNLIPMCYDKRYLTQKLEKYARRYGHDEAEVSFIYKQIEQLNLPPAYHASGFDHPFVPIIYDKTKSVTKMSWGLIPNWTKTAAEAVQISNRTINARAETMFEKSAFREAARERRCLVLVDGFYEHHHKNSKTFPHHIHFKDDAPMTLAGLWDEWHDPASGLVRRTYTVVTTRANALLARIHNNPKSEEGPRMPLILPKEVEWEWLKPAGTKEDQQLIADLVKSYDEKALEAFTVRRLRGKEAVGNKPAAIEPVRYPELEEQQGSLF
jgi:putative SOS response-associated peptidase YedK